MELIVDATGQVRAIYDEAIDVKVLGHVSVQRASHVEPAADGAWTADLSPVGGPVLGPFATRFLALEAERQWLSRYWLVHASAEP